MQQAHRGALAMESLFGIIPSDAISLSLKNKIWLSRWFQQSNSAVFLPAVKSLGDNGSSVLVLTDLSWSVLLDSVVIVTTRHTVNVSW